MSHIPSIDEAIDLSLDVLERDDGGDSGALASWIVDNLVHVLDEYRAGESSMCVVSSYCVTRVMDKIVVVAPKSDVMDSEEARMLAATLLRAAEAADQEN